MISLHNYCIRRRPICQQSGQIPQRNTMIYRFLLNFIPSFFTVSRFRITEKNYPRLAEKNFSREARTPHDRTRREKIHGTPFYINRN